MFYWGLLFGAWIGCAVGILVICLCQAAARGDKIMAGDMQAKEDDIL